MSRLFSRRRMITAGGTAAVALPLTVPTRAMAASSSGQLKTLLSPVRVFDSRQPGSVLGGAKFQPGDVVAVTVSAAYQDGDTFASAVFANVTITQTEGAGFLAIRGDDLSGTLPPPSTSNINWDSSGVTLANLALSTVGGEHAIAVHCGGSGRTHVIVDVQGYVPFVV
jgi:hypothetical protein